jgi:hypothetical protein
MATQYFVAGASKTPKAPIKVEPSGMSCSAELWLSTDAATKAATSGKVSFTSTGALQNVSLPVTLPTAGGTYKVYLDVYYGTTVLGNYVATDSVAVIAITVGDITWS